jgi:hypothetical protein
MVLYKLVTCISWAVLGGQHRQVLLYLNWNATLRQMLHDVRVYTHLVRNTVRCGAL